MNTLTDTKHTAYIWVNWLYMNEKQWGIQTAHCVSDMSVMEYGKDAYAKWANPFIVGTHGKRGECIDMYRTWIMTQPQLLADLYELEGKVLGCWCYPRPCHGNVLLELLEKHDILEY